MPEKKKCYECGAENPEQAFCGTCGNPLALGEYTSAKVSTQIKDAIRDRDVLEMDSSITVFKQAWSWIRLIIATAAGLLILAGGGFLWKASDFWSGVNKAKQSVEDTAKKSSKDIAQNSMEAKADISRTLADGQAAIRRAAADVSKRSQAMKEATLKSRAEISKETAGFKNDLDRSHRELEAASKIQPEMNSLQEQMAHALAQIKAQQEVLSSSENFAKSIFSSHVTQFFWVGKSPNDHYAVIPPPHGGNRSVVFLLLKSVPIKGTLQVQFYIYTQPQNSFVSVENLVVFFWGDSLESLKSHQLGVSYFPDTGDKDTIHALSERDGRAYADGQPLPKLNQPDPDFKGDKWFRFSQGATK